MVSHGHGEIEMKWKGVSQAIGITLAFTSWPFLSFMAHNIEEGDYYLRITFIWIAITALCCLIVLATSRFISAKHTVQSAFALGAFVVCLFLYSSVVPIFVFLGLHEIQEIWIAFWLMISLVIAVAIWRYAARRILRRALAVAVAVMLALPLWQIASFLITSTPGAVNLGVPPPTGGTPLGPKRNVYWIVADAYSRDDILKTHFGWDNTPFLRALIERGFLIGAGSQANYPRTSYSIAATLQMEYFKPYSAKPRHGNYAPALRGFNNTVRIFKSWGYRYLHAEPGGGITKTQCGGQEDRCITPRLSGDLDLTEAEVGLLKLTPFYHLAKNYLSDVFRFAYSDVRQFKGELRIRQETPFFLFSHFLVPHPPVRFDKNCSSIDIPLSYFEGWNVDAYVRNVRCLNAQLLELIDLILREDLSDPIIIISSDHGNTFSNDGDETSKIFFPILMAMRLPEPRCRDSFYASISPVNQFRLVFGCLTKQEPKFLRDRYFLPIEDGFREIDGFPRNGQSDRP